MDILMQMQAYGAAEEIYLYGKHANSTSLAELASSSGRELIPQFDLFVSYFNSETYAHDLVHGALVGSDVTEPQRRLFVLRFSQTLILEHAAYEAIFQSISSCEAGKESEESTDLFGSWDKAAGLLLGSIERSTMRDSDNLYTPYDLAQGHCLEFGTCSSKDQAEANERLIELLYAGRGALNSGSCDGLRKIGEDIVNLLLIPRIQATLSSSLKLSHSSRTSDDATEAYIYSRSLLPLIEDADVSVATSIENTIALGGKFHKKTGRSIFASFAMIYNDLDVDCVQVGQTKEFNACDVSYVAEKESSLPLILGSVCLALAICIVIAVIIYWQRILGKNINPTDTEEVVDDGHSLNSLASGYGLRNASLSPKALKALGKISSYGDDHPILEFEDDDFTDEDDIAAVEDDDVTYIVSNQKNADII
jgi:hypothetical protein